MAEAVEMVVVVVRGVVTTRVAIRNLPLELWQQTRKVRCRELREQEAKLLLPPGDA